VISFEACDPLVSIGRAIVGVTARNVREVAWTLKAILPSAATKVRNERHW
jgi:hypothetical protein